MMGAVNNFINANLINLLIFIYQLIFNTYLPKYSFVQTKYESLWSNIPYYFNEPLTKKRGVLLADDGQRHFAYVNESSPMSLERHFPLIVTSRQAILFADQAFEKNRCIDGCLINNRGKNDSYQKRVVKYGKYATNYSVRRKQLLQSSLGDRSAKLFSALVFGEQKEIPPDIKQAFLDTGTLHLAALSGSNVTAWLLMVEVGAQFLINRRKKTLMYIIGVIVLMSCVQLSASIARAAAMALFQIGCWSIRRPYNRVYGAICSGIMLLCLKPEWISDLGFILSFVCVSALLIFHINIDEPTYIWNLLQGILVSLICSSATLPILLLAFGQINYNGVIFTPVIALLTTSTAIFGLSLFIPVYYLSYIWWEAAVFLLSTLFYIPLMSIERLLAFLQQFSYLNWQVPHELKIPLFYVCVSMWLLFLIGYWKVSSMRKNRFLL